MWKTSKNETRKLKFHEAPTTLNLVETNKDKEAMMEDRKRRSHPLEQILNINTFEDRSYTLHWHIH